MEAKGKHITRTSSLGDKAVDGLFSGAAAGFAMALYLAAAMLLSGQNWLSALNAEQELPLGVLALAHLAVSGVYGILFSLMARTVLQSGQADWQWLAAGLVYGGLLALLGQVLLLPSAGLESNPVPFIHFWAAHGIYGLVLSWLLLRWGTAG